MNSIGAKKGEIFCNKSTLIIELIMALFVFTSCLFILIFNITHELMAIIVIYIIAISSLSILIYKSLELYKGKIQLFEKGFVIIKPLKKVIIHKKDIKSITWHESINIIGSTPISHKCNIKLKDDKDMSLSDKYYINLYKKLSRINYL